MFGKILRNQVSKDAKYIISTLNKVWVAIITSLYAILLIFEEIGSKLQHDKTKNSISWGFRYTHLTASCSIVYTVPPEAYLVACQIRAATDGLMSLQYLLFLSFCSSSCSSRFFSFDDFCELLENNKQPLNQYTAIRYKTNSSSSIAVKSGVLSRRWTINTNILWKQV